MGELGWEDPLEKGRATHSSILAWRIPWTTVHGIAKESDTTERLSLSLFTLSGDLALDRPSLLLFIER